MGGGEEKSGGSGKEEALTKSERFTGTTVFLFLFCAIDPRHKLRHCTCVHWKYTTKLKYGSRIYTKTH
jgi:hypothetical protein